MRTPVDMAYELAEWLNVQDHRASTTPLPDDFANHLPITLITTLGGSRTWPVVDTHRLHVDVYGETMAEALEEGRAVFAALDTINDTYPIVGGVQTYNAEFGGLPAEADDPNHPNVPVCAFIVQIMARAQED